MNKIILTADRPTGKLHLGHYVGSLMRRVQLQNEGAYDDFYIMVADSQALTDNYGNVQKAVAGAEGTTVTDKTLWQAARKAALGAHFNMSAEAPPLQQGTITYIFKLD